MSNTIFPFINLFITLITIAITFSVAYGKIKQKISDLANNHTEAKNDFKAFQIRVDEKMDKINTVLNNHITEIKSTLSAIKQDLKAINKRIDKLENRASKKR